MFSMQHDVFGDENGSRASVPPAIRKAAQILRAVAAQPGKFGVSELARRTHLSKSTVHGLLTALADEHFLVAHAGGYRLGPALLDLGARAVHDHIAVEVGPVVRALRTATGDTALFGRGHPRGVEILIVEEGTGQLNLSAPLHSVVPLLAGALGKAHLASLDRALAFAEVERADAAQFRRPFHDHEKYWQEVDRAKHVGYATERGEYLPGIAAAAATFSWQEAPHFIWTIGLDATRNDEELATIGVHVRDAARRAHSRLTAQRDEIAKRSVG